MNNRLTIILSAVAVVVALAVAAVAISASRDSGGDSASGGEKLEWQPVEVTGSPLPPASDQQGTPNQAAGEQAPTVAGKTFGGQDVRIAPDGRKKVVMFWAHWCPHCQNELPKLAPWISRNGGNYDVDFYSVATGTNPTRPNFPPSEWFEDEKYPLPVMADSRTSAAANAFGLTSYPYIVALDGSNRVVTRSSGEIGVSGFEALVQRTAAAP